MKVVICEPGQYARIADIEPTLKAKQEIVGGLIDCVYPWPNDMVGLVCNDEGKSLCSAAFRMRIPLSIIWLA